VVSQPDLTGQRLVEVFGLGSLEAMEPLSGGLLNQTWRLTTATGYYIAQGLHPIFDQGVTTDAQYIAAHLRQYNFPVPEFLATREGYWHWEDSQGSWRVMTCLPGVSYRTAPHLNYLEQAGQLTGKFHQLVQDLRYDFTFHIPHFHDTAYILQELMLYAEVPMIQREAAFFIDTIPKLSLPTSLPRHIIHGDLKLANFLFDEAGVITGLVDLDTLMVHDRLIELGDAFRSWGTVGETFSEAALIAGLRGYLAIATLDAQELDYLIPAIQLITLELGMRYLKDVVEDCYFQWDAQQYPSRAAHNLSRARRQIAVYRDLCRQEPSLRTAISGIMKRNLP